MQVGTPEDILTDPADEYVERFIEDVDYAKVRYVDTVMVEPKEVAYDSEGPRVVLPADEAGRSLDDLYRGQRAPSYRHL